MKNRAIAVLALMIAASILTGCILGDYEDVLYPMYGEMTFVPNGYTCTGDEGSGQIGQLAEMRDGDLPVRVDVGASCLVPNLPDEWTAKGGGQSARFNFSIFWPEGETLADVGPSGEWFTPPGASFNILIVEPRPPGCFGSGTGEQRVEMYISGEMPSFDYIDIRADGDCARANFHIPGGDP